VTALILHHYPESSYSEKIRTLLGFKGLSWQSVIAPDVMPKPVLTALTGGYRLVPVLQRGSDIFCGSDCIAMELDRIAPDPALASDHAAQEAFGQWGEAIFSPLVTIALARGVFSDAFVADRQVMSGPGFNPQSAAKYEPWQLHRAERQFADLDAHLSDGRAYLSGAMPGLGDFAAYHPIWSLSALGLSGLLDRYPNLKGWNARMAAIGHGIQTAITGDAALAAAIATEPQPLANKGSHPFVGQSVKARHDGYDGGAVAGVVDYCDTDRIALGRDDETLGRLRVWFAVRDCIVTLSTPKAPKKDTA